MEGYRTSMMVMLAVVNENEYMIFYVYSLGRIIYLITY